MNTICPILGRPTPVEKTAFSRGAWSIVRCQQTGFIFLANPPEYARLEEEFAWEKTGAAERARREAEEPIWSGLSALLKRVKSSAFPKRDKIASIAFGVLPRGGAGDQPLRVLDIGCGGGNLLVKTHDHFSQDGRQVIPLGIEVSRRLAARSHQRVASLGGRVVCANAIDGADGLQGERVDLVLMSSFLEHECQPLPLLRRLRTLLAPEGVVVVKVPNFQCWNRLLRGRKWCGFRFPDHVNYFTPKTLRTLAHEAGFTIARQNLSDRFPLSDNMYAVLTKQAEPVREGGTAPSGSRSGIAEADKARAA